MIRRLRNALSPAPAALAAVALLLPAAASAQLSVESSDLTPRQSPWQGWGVFRSLTVKDSTGASTKVTQVSTPMSLKLRLSNNASVVVYSAFARTEVGPDSSGAAKRTLSGVTDTRAKLFLHTGSTVFSAGVSLPSGKHTLTSDEDLVASALSTDVFGFRVRRMGEGFDAQAGLTHALEAGDNGALALGVSYLYRGSFKPVDGSELSYRPGSELSASAGYDFNTPSTLLRLDAAVRVYTKDQSDGVPVFRQGTAFVLEERWVARTTGRITNDLALHQVLKGSSEFFSGSTGSTSAGTTENGSSFGAAERLEIQLGRATRFAALAEGDFYGKSDTGYDSAHLLSFGGELAWLPASTATVRLMARALTGSADPGSVKLSGFDVGGTLRVVF